MINKQSTSLIQHEYFLIKVEPFRQLINRSIDLTKHEV